VKNKVGGTVLLTLTTENGGITLDNVAKTITLFIDAATTAALTWKTGVYDLEMVSGADVTELYSGKITVTFEVTT
jgi:nicotinate-nucleotide pyrophosphorylase